MTKDDYWGKFIPFTVLFFILSIFLFYVPNLDSYGVSLLLSTFVFFALMVRDLINGKKMSDILTLIYLYMLVIFIIVFFLVVSLGGIIHSAFSSLLTTSLLFLFFTFDTSDSNKKNKIIMWLSVLIYTFTCLMFQPSILWFSYENPILEYLTYEESEKIIASVEFQRVSFFMFLVCVLNTIWALPFCYKYRIAIRDFFNYFRDANKD